MPSTNHAPSWALMAALDLRAWAGVELFSLEHGDSSGVTAVSLPSGVDWQDTAVFIDPVDALSGRRSPQGLGVQAALQAAWTAAAGAATTWTVGLDEDDRVYVQSSDVDFSITNASTLLAALGFTAAAESLVGGSDPFRHTAALDWTRGAVNLRPAAVTDGVTSVTLPAHRVHVQSVPVWLRSTTTADADAAVTYSAGDFGTLEDLTIAALAAASRPLPSFRAYLSGSGRVVLSWAHTSGAVSFAWGVSADDLRARLGFSGRESIVTAITGMRYLIAEHPCPGVLVPSRPLERFDGTARVAGSALGLTSGVYAGVTVGAYQEWEARGWLDSLLDETDLEAHFARRVAPYLGPGARVTVYPEWGDTRRAHRGAQSAADPAYSTLRTSQDGGYRGRVPGYIIGATEWSYAPPGAMRRRIPVAVRLSEAP